MTILIPLQVMSSVFKNERLDLNINCIKSPQVVSPVGGSVQNCECLIKLLRFAFEML